MERKVIRRTVEPEDEPELELEDQDLGDEADEELEDVEEEEEEVKPVVKRTVKPAPAPTKPVAKPAPKPVVKKVAHVEEEDEEVEPAPVKATKPAPKPIAKPAPAAVTKKVVRAQEEDDNEVGYATVKPVAQAVADNLVTRIMDAMAAGQSVTLTKLDNGDFAIRDAKLGPKTAKNADVIKYEDYENIVLSPEYREFRESWRGKTLEEKIALARKAKISWEEHSDPRINLMRLMDAWTKGHGIEKYVEAYRDPKARKQLRQTGA